MHRLRNAVIAALVVVFAVATATPAVAHPSRFDEYYGYFDVGQNTIPFTDSKWVPQGLAKLGDDRLLITYYDYKEVKNSRVAIVNGSDGSLVTWFNLDIKGHVGGAAITGKYLWITYAGGLRRYARADLGTTAKKGTLKAQKQFPVAGSASYAGAEGNSVWVGNFTWAAGHTCPTERETMYKYRVTSTGELSYVESKVTPSKIQGVAFTSTKIIWSQSCGRDNVSKLIVWDRSRSYDANWDYGNVVDAPNMSEGITLSGDQLQVVYESGSDAYDGTADGDAASYIIRSIHHGSVPPI